MEPVESIDYLTDSEPAPGRLASVQRFVNTVDFEHGREMLSEPSRLHAALDLDPAARLGAAELKRALAVREALRGLALANNGAQPNRRDLATLEDAAERGRLVVRFDAHASSLEPATRSLDGALADLVGIVYTAMADGTWPRLKACRREVCQWLFYDRSRNHSAVWCRMAVCGNRTKTKAYRARKSGGGPRARTGRR
ncbi:MAG: hypothetical protein QOF43_1928 [Gaiellaceae bacterium]|nr:hypothetical protein [Gaiellaceae bacterium]